ncbi:hypothetical protein CWC35_12810 [Staphylococcus epidermidis]|nr:hypothetical protein CWC35_12810 [Staphylococcus epidermidis]PJM52889.1 hypothetical protein CWB54_12655 [Staphylococcus epidermidis]
MRLNEINKVIKKVSEELTNINKKYNTDINIFLRITEVITIFYLLIMMILIIMFILIYIIKRLSWLIYTNIII